MSDVLIPEVRELPQVARFFREGERDFVEISYVGAKDTVIRKVTPEHMARFRNEWDAYCDGRPMTRRTGTPLTDVPGVDEKREEYYVHRNIHTADELAVLSDAQCQAVGHGTLTHRQAARQLISMRQMERDERNRKAISDASARIGAAPSGDYASASDVTELKNTVGELAQSVAALVAALAPKPRGRPPKPKDE